MKRLAMVAAIIMALFPNQVSAQINAVLPVTCNPNSPGECVKSTPVVNPDGTAIGAGGGSGTPTGTAGSPNVNVVSVQGVTNGTPQNVSQQDVTGSGSLALATANATYPIPINGGRNAVGLTITGLTGSGATVTVERSNNGGTVWTNANTTESSATASLSSTITADGQARVGVAGATNIRLRVSTTGTGTATIAYNATTAAGPVFLTSNLPSVATWDTRIIGGVDNSSIRGVATSTGSGVIDAGTQRFTPATDSAIQTNCVVDTVGAAPSANLARYPCLQDAYHAIRMYLGVPGSSGIIDTRAPADGLGGTLGLGTTTQNLVWNGTAWVMARGDAIGTYIVAQPVATASAGVYPTATTAVASSLVLKGAAGNLYGINITTGATAGYLMLLNATAAPADGAVTPIKCVPVAANTGLVVPFNTPLAFTTGITAVFSSTGCFSKTASATAFISGDAK